MEDGTLAVIFALWALLRLDWDQPFARAPASPGATFAIGQTYFNRTDNGFEIRAHYLRDHRFGPLQPMFDVSVSEKGGIYVGTGFYQRAMLADPVYVAGSGVTGLWFEGDDRDLGGLLEFRTTLEIGVEVGGGDLGLAWDHRSNLNIGRINPGLEVLSLRYTARF